MIVIKVSQFRKDFIKFSFAPKMNENIFVFLPLAYKKRSNQTSSVRESK